MKTKKMLFLSVISLLSLAGCARGTGSESSSEEAKSEQSSSVSSEPQPASTSSQPESTSVPESSSSEPAQPSSAPAPVYDDRVSVFVLSGQSNMQGNSSSSEANLRQAFEDLGFDDYDDVAEGMPEVQTSLYCAGYGELNHENLNNNSRLSNCTNKETPFDGLFVPTRGGLGNSANQMGPEFGAAYVLKDYATDDKPIFFIKMASNGSGFAQSGTQYNWPVKDENGDFPEINLYSSFAKPFIENNLALIEEMGYTPVIKAWLWHQGESDSASEKIPVYGQRLGDMLELFREDFADYALDEDGDNIAFIDGMIYQGSGTAWGAQTSVQMNEEKQKFADEDDSHYIVDIYANEEPIPENELKPGNPGGDSMHYSTKSQLRLGMAYGNVIVDNGLLDF